MPQTWLTRCGLICIAFSLNATTLAAALAQDRKLDIGRFSRCRSARA